MCPTPLHVSIAAAKNKTKHAPGISSFRLWWLTSALLYNQPMQGAAAPLEAMVSRNISLTWLVTPAAITTATAAVTIASAAASAITIAAGVLTVAAAATIPAAGAAAAEEAHRPFFSPPLTRLFFPSCRTYVLSSGRFATALFEDEPTPTRSCRVRVLREDFEARPSSQHRFLAFFMFRSTRQW